jgi:hypothetical protein
MKKKHRRIFVVGRILMLQRDRFFDDLAARTWNQTQRSLCNLGANIDAGITLESIGPIYFFRPLLKY